MVSELQADAAQAVPSPGSGVLVSQPAGAHKIAGCTPKLTVVLTDWGTVLEMTQDIVVALDDVRPEHQAQAVALLRAWLAPRPLGIAAIAFAPGRDVPASLITELAERRILVVRQPGRSARERAERFLQDLGEMDAQALRLQHSHCGG